MATYGTGDFTNFRNLRVRGNVGDAGGDPGAVRFVANSSFEGTMSVSTGTPTENNLKWALSNSPNVGGIGLTGTFTVQMPAITSWSETAVTITGMRREDAVLCQIQDMMGTVTTGRTFPIIAGARPENGYLYLTFYNPTGTATIAHSFTVAYTSFR